MKKQIKISEVLALLNDGKTREMIAEELELSKTEVSKLFQHPKLKGKKAKKAVTFELFDDTEEELEVQNLEITENISTFEEVSQ